MVIWLVRVVALLIWGAALPVAGADICVQPCVEVTGVASYADSGVAYARQMALRDGLRSAIMRCQVTVSAQQKVRNFQLTGSNLSVRSHAVVNHFTILSERQDPDQKLIYMRMKVCLQAATDMCDQPFSTGFSPRLAIAPPVVVNPYDTRDIRGLTDGYRQALISIMQQRGYSNVTEVGLDPAMLSRRRPEPVLDRQRLQTLQEETGAHFLLLTVIQSLASRHRVEDTPLPDSVDRLMDAVVHHYDRYEARNNVRDVTVGWYLIDLDHDHIVASGQVSRHVEGDVYVGRDRPFGSLAFRRTRTGRALMALVEDEADRVRSKLRCAGFESRVLEVHRDRKDRPAEVVFFATPASGLREGDQLTVYHRDGRSVRMGVRSLGVDEEPVGFVRIKRLLDRFAIAEIVAEKVAVQEGDTIRSW